MELSCQQKPDTISHNVIGEITGYQFPHEVILVGGHLDSWDIGEGLTIVRKNDTLNFQVKKQDIDGYSGFI